MFYRLLKKEEDIKLFVKGISLVVNLGKASHMLLFDRSHFPNLFFLLCTLSFINYIQLNNLTQRAVRYIIHKNNKYKQKIK